MQGLLTVLGERGGLLQLALLVRAPRPESSLLPLASAPIEWFLQTIQSESVSGVA